MCTSWPFHPFHSPPPPLWQPPVCSVSMNPGLMHCRWILYQLSHKGSQRILEWVAYPFFRGSSRPRDRTRSPALQADALTSEPPGKPYIWRRQWHPTPVLLPGKSHGQRSLVGCSPWGRWESDMTQRLHFHFSLLCTGEGNGNPLQCSCLENPRDRGAWWAAVYGVTQSQTRLK